MAAKLRIFLAFPINRLIDRVLHARTDIQPGELIVRAAGIHPVAQEYINEPVVGIYPKARARKSRMAIDRAGRQLTARRGDSCSG